MKVFFGKDHFPARNASHTQPKIREISTQSVRSSSFLGENSVFFLLRSEKKLLAKKNFFLYLYEYLSFRNEWTAFFPTGLPSS